ncbi:MAG: DUF4435 domain-containing protein [Bacteroidaceae bacterium]|jgi:hypothetical protein|nr:DUF4435 domain-containing protein [Bacteroidaceae bacterium]MBQ6225231.1 DUF4435 domain-containing protein [Bacteroidaceae bacterium]
MAKRLQEHLNSNYFELASKLRPKNAARKVVAYVESYDDVFFWRSVLQDFETDRIKFEVMLPSRYSLCKGKKAALMNKLGPSLGDFMIACVDADYDYIMQGATEISRTLLSSPFIIHTYAYAIENYQCYAPALHTACVMSTLNDRDIISLEAFMEEYSKIIWPLFVWSIWAHKNGQASTYSITAFSQTVTFHDINPYHPENALEHLRDRVNKQIGWLQRKYPKAKDSYLNLRKSLQEELGIRPAETYLYIQGHALMEGVVLPLLNPICNMLRREREKEIQKLALHGQQKQNELSGYRHSQSAIDLMLRKSVEFKQSAPYQLLTADIERLIEHINKRLPA